MGPVYHMLGMAAAFINETTDKAGRRRSYEADVTYLTARESGFDYLRGFLAFDPADLVQRPFNFAIIDEADSILIDEARIPLVIAGDMPAHTEIDKKLYKVVASMKEGVHFNTDENGSAVYLEEEGIAYIEKQLRIKNLYDDLNLRFLRHDRHRLPRGGGASAVLRQKRHRRPAPQALRPHRPSDVIFTHKEAKYEAVAAEIRKAREKGRPVLVGTASIEESERIADMLRGDIPDIAVLNAKNDEKEAGIIAGAGRVGAVTISTNMAGRGVDIRLGGKDSKEYGKVCSLGGLYVIGTNRHESVRVDNQLRGRAGRQGDPGESRFFISLEDDLVVRYGLFDSLPAKYKGLKQAGPLTNPAFGKAIVHTQKVVEGQRFDAKVTLFKYAATVEDQRRLVHRRRTRILLGGPFALSRQPSGRGPDDRQGQRRPSDAL
jgi:preprotein translocase subunit SecA